MWAMTPGMNDLPGGQLGLLPQLPFVIVPRVGGLDGKTLRLHLEHDVDDLFQGNVVLVRTLGAAPADVQANLALGDAARARLIASTRRSAYFR